MWGFCGEFVCCLVIKGCLNEGCLMYYKIENEERNILEENDGEGRIVQGFLVMNEVVIFVNKRWLVVV